jgi:hypothetical protein
MRIQLTKSELIFCKLVGKMRYQTTSSVCEEQIQSELNPETICVDGVIGEYCVAKQLNLHFSLNTDLRVEWGADLVTHEGRTIDVKTTRSRRGDLNATLTSVNKKFDIYVLCVLEPDGCDIVGWIYGNQFLIPENIVQGVKGDYYKITKDKLNTNFKREEDE